MSETVGSWIVAIVVGLVAGLFAGLLGAIIGSIWGFGAPAFWLVSSIVSSAVTSWLFYRMGQND